MLWVVIKFVVFPRCIRLSTFQRNRVVLHYFARSLVPRQHISVPNYNKLLFYDRFDSTEGEITIMLLPLFDLIYCIVKTWAVFTYAWCFLHMYCIHNFLRRRVNIEYFDALLHICVFIKLMRFRISLNRLFAPSALRLPVEWSVMMLLIPSSALMTRLNQL